ncbi:MAG: competence type IV pilus major pilin ComGC [Planctomycetota bacterium]
MRDKRGFTLVELLIVVLILGALAAIVVPRITQSAQKSKTNACAANVDILQTQVELYAADNDGSYPATLSVVTSDPNYFPDGAPSCPLSGTYSVNSNDQVFCSH